MTLPIEPIELPPPVDRAEFKRRIKEERRVHRRESTDRRLQLWGRRLSDIGNWCYGGTVKLIQFPAYVFDLLDRYGKPDHSKIGPFLVSQELVALQAYDVIVNRKPLQLGIVVLIGVLSFASMSLMRKFLDKTNIDVRSDTQIVDVTAREITERRDATTGMEATP